MNRTFVYHLTSLAAVAGLLLGAVSLAQQGPEKPPDKGAQKAPEKPSPAEKNTDKPRSDNANRDNPNRDARKPEQSKPDDRTPPRSADRPQRSDRDERSTQRDDRTPRQPDRTDRDTRPRQETDRRDANRRDADRRETDRPDVNRRETDRRDANRDPNRRDTSSDRSTRDRKQVSASDIGFSFAAGSSEDGLKISKVSSDSAAFKAKFQTGDVIIKVNDHRITSQDDFVRWIHDSRERITVIVLRDEREVTLYLEPDVIFEEVRVAGGAWLGVDLVDRITDAAVVYRVHPGSPAERAGLRSDDLILTVDGERIQSPEHLGKVIGAMQPGSEVEIEVDRNDRTRVVDATLGRKETVTQRRSLLPRR